VPEVKLQGTGLLELMGGVLKCSMQRGSMRYLARVPTLWLGFFVSDSCLWISYCRAPLTRSSVMSGSF
jgi:hypothetical protein